MFLLKKKRKRKNNRDRMKIIRHMLSVNERNICWKKNKRRIGLTKGDIMMVVVRRK